jgi:hypothetical protein
MVRVPDCCQILSTAVLKLESADLSVTVLAFRIPIVGVQKGSSDKTLLQPRIAFDETGRNPEESTQALGDCPFGSLPPREVQNGKRAGRFGRRSKGIASFAIGSFTNFAMRITANACGSGE